MRKMTNPAELAENRPRQPDKLKKRVFSDNGHEISKINQRMLRSLSFVLSVLMPSLFFLSLRLPALNELDRPYAFFFLMSVLVYFASGELRGGAVLPLIYLYFLSLVVFSVYGGIFLHVSHPPIFIFVTLLIFPMIVIDRRWRINMAIVFVCSVYCSLSFLYKPFSYSVAALINVTISSVLGIAIGRHLTAIKLENIETRRQLALQRDTDILTSLPNRRKLFEVLGEMELEDSLTPLTGVIMIDIDNFKNYNDFYGHVKGDECLSVVGSCLRLYSEKYAVAFFRYGGEEFIGLSTEYSYKEIGAIAESLRETIRGLDVRHRGSSLGVVTCSVGYAEKAVCASLGHEELIVMADRALYAAKSMGGDRAAGFLEATENEGGECLTLRRKTRGQML